MRVKDLFTLPSLQNAKLLTPKADLDRLISSVNVLEATDVENWARRGMIILTSLFALSDYDEARLETFIQRLVQLQIAALIVKIERLYNNMPPALVSICQKYHLPLLEIQGSIPYESIILEILDPILKANREALMNFYQIHDEFVQLSLHMLPLNQTIQLIAEKFKMELSLISYDNKTYHSHDSLLNLPIIKEETFNHPLLHYDARRKTYQKNEQLQQLIHLKIPFVNNHHFELYCHSYSANDTDLAIIFFESAAHIIQRELLKKYCLKQGRFLNRNNTVYDMLIGNLQGENLEKMLAHSGIHHQQVRILSIQLHHLPSAQDRLYALSACRQVLTHLGYRYVFHELSNEMRIIIGIDDVEFPIQSLDSALKDKILRDYPGVIIQWALSQAAIPSLIPQLYQEVLAMQGLFIKNKSHYYSYEELGVLKILLYKEEKAEMMAFIPEKIRTFYEREPDLFKTYEAFLRHQQHYSQTADELFLHPKTIKYRLDKIKTQYGFDPSDTDHVLDFQLSAKLIEVIYG